MGGKLAFLIVLEMEVEKAWNVTFLYSVRKMDFEKKTNREVESCLS